MHIVLECNQLLHKFENTHGISGTYKHDSHTYSSTVESRDYAPPPAFLAQVPA